MNTPQFCLLLDKKGGVRSLRLSQVNSSVKQPIWIHIDYKDEDNLEWLHSLKFDETVLENLIDADTSPRCFRHGKGFVMVMRGVNPRKGEEDDMVALHVWMTKNRLLTLSHRPVEAVAKVLEKLQHKKGPKTVGDCLASLCFEMTKQIEESLLDISDIVDDLDERVLEQQGDLRQDKTLRENLSQVRHMIVGLRRYILPQRNVIEALEKTTLSCFSEHNVARFREIGRDLTAVIDGLEFARDHSKVTQEELDSQTNINISRTMYLMSLIMVIFTPLTFVTGLLGANIGGIPLNASPYGFITICGVLILIVLLQLIFLKKMKWF